MHHPKIIATLAVLIAAWLLAACAPPATPTPTEPPALSHTAAAATIIAQLTQLAAPPSATPAPATSTPAALPPTTGPLTTATPAVPATLPPPSEPAPTEPPTAVPTPAASPTATVVLPAGDPRRGLGEPAWSDVFDTGENWYIYNDANAAIEVVGGEMQMTARQANNRYNWMLTWPEVSDYYLETAVRTGTCSGGDRYGLFVRTPDAVEGYLFAVSCDGQFAFIGWDGSQRDMLVDWTASEAVQKGPDAANRLGIWVQGETFKLYANGQLLAETSSAVYDGPYFGIFVSAVDTPEFTVYYDEIRYWELQ